MFFKALSIIVTVFALVVAHSQAICPAYYCSYSGTNLTYHQIDKPLLDQLIIKDNPKLLEWANCQTDNRTETPAENLIVWLSYRDNKLLEIQNGKFAKYINLTVLMLNDSHELVLHNGSLHGLWSLEFLHLQNNGIKYIPKGFFKPLGNIVWIDLSNNKIDSLKGDIFPLLRSFKGLDLRKNPLTEISLTIWKLTSIDNVLLSDCPQLENVYLDVDIFNLTLENSGVKRLTISRGIRRILAENSTLTYLNLNGAQIKNFVLSDILCRSPTLEWLDLSFNFLRTVDLYSSSLHGECLLPNLKFLNLSFNDIYFLQMGSPLFGRRLTTLDLSYNKLHDDNLEILKQAHSLQSLHLDNNCLNSFDYRSACDQFKNLTNLTLNGNGNNFNDIFYHIMENYLNECHKDQYPWIWITVPIIVVLLIALVWQVLRSRGKATASETCMYEEVQMTPTQSWDDFEAETKYL